MKILLIEDDNLAIKMIQELLIFHLKRPCKFQIAYSLEEGLKCLRQGPPDIILLDLTLPDSPQQKTFDKVYAKAQDIPIVVMTVTDDDRLAVEYVKKGAQDYLIKGDFHGRLFARVIDYAIERKKLMLQLGKSWEQVKRLTGMLPICSYCKKIRNDKGYWEQLERYIAAHSDAIFSHGMCPACRRRKFPELSN